MCVCVCHGLVDSTFSFLILHKIMIVLQLDSNLNWMNYTIPDKFSATGVTVVEKGTM